MNINDFPHALCMWREARGEGEVGMKAVSCVIRNRAKKSGISIYEEVVKPLQFSAMTAKGDPMLNVYPSPTDKEWLIAQRIVEDENLADITSGATHYFNPSVVMPSWASKLTKTASIGNHDFYKV